MRSYIVISQRTGNFQTVKARSRRAAWLQVREQRRYHDFEHVIVFAESAGAWYGKIPEPTQVGGE